jgi:4-diphosphocytidyl-2-C-methyl-D-erythritol kinase
MKAPAKVNLHLDILELRDDGYHDLVSVMQMVSLYDHIVVSTETESDVVAVQGDYPLDPRNNTISEAIRIFRQELSIKKEVSASVVKRIPIGAGLGGGSSDAASVLQALDLLFETGLSDAELNELAKQLGSDVPFFLGSPAAVISGVGDIVVPLEARSSYAILLVCPDFSIGTAEAYRYYDRWLDKQADRKKSAHKRRIRIEDLTNLYECAHLSEWSFTNSFQGPIEERYPVIENICRKLRSIGACLAGISGSGSSMIGVFETEPEAKHALRSFEADFSLVQVVTPLEMKPRPVLK